MKNLELTNLEIDDLLFDLLGKVKGNISDLGFVEPSIVILHHCSHSGSSVECDQYIRRYAHTIANVITPRTVPTLEFDTLSALPFIFGTMERVAENAIPPEYIELRGMIEYWRALRLFMAGGGCPDELRDEFQYKLQRLRIAPAYDRINLAMASLNFRHPEHFSLGKTVRAKLDLRIAGDISFRRKSEPFVAFRGRVLEHDDPFASQLLEAVGYAERYFSETLGQGEIEKIPRQYTIGVAKEESSPDWARLFTGGSAGLGFSLLSMAAIDGLHVRKNERQIRSDAAFTGSIDAKGNVVAVDGQTIPHKLKSVFFSHNRHFVVPEQNLEVAQTALDSLKETYPERDLEIVPARTVQQVYEDDRVMEPKKIPSSTVVASKMSRRRKIVAAASAFVLLFAVLGFLVPPRFAREMAETSFDGKTIRFYNRYGYNFDSYDLPYHIKVKEDNNYNDTSSKSHRLIVDDVNSDGSKELLFIGVEADSNATRPEGRIHLHLFSSSGKQINYIALMDSAEYYYRGNRGVFYDFTYCKDELIDIDGDRHKDLILSTNNSLFWFSAILNISLKTGEVQEFRHVGHMIRFTTGDFDNDGKKEIVAGGECQALRPGVIAILDPENMTGTAPSIGALTFPGYEKNIAKYYIQVPTSIVCGNIDSCDRPFVNTVETFDNDHLQIGVLEGRSATSANALIYFFDEEWRCESVVSTTPYASVFSEVMGLDVEDAELARNELEAYLESLKGEFRYLNGTKWESDPVVNSGYTEATRQ